MPDFHPPSVLWVLNEPHEIEYTPLDTDEDGVYTLGHIRVWGKASPRRQIRSLIHEFAHGVFRAFTEPGAEIKEENFARAFEVGVISLLAENRQFVQDVLSYLVEGE